MNADKTEYDIKVKLGGVTEITDELERTVIHSKCEDANLSQCECQVYLTFTRTGETVEQAVHSALRDAADVFPEAELEFVEHYEI